MFTLDDDDGDFTAPPRGSSKLASLFGSEGGPSMDQGNDSLMYTPQKQPKYKGDTNAAAKNSGDEALKLIHAVAAHTYRFVNGRYTSQGKLGVAILGNAAVKDYKLLLYVSQKQPVAAAKITANFNYTVQKSNYAGFQDDMAQMWSICFDSEAQSEEFAKQIAVAKFNCHGVSLVSLDLVPGDGQEIQKGDMVETQYKGWLLTNHLIGKVFDTNEQSGKLFKFKVGRGKVIKGWEEGVIGLRKGGKRVLVIPSGLAYGSKGIPDRIPGHASLVFTMTVKRVKFSNPESAESSSQSSSRTESPNLSKQEAAPVSMPAEAQLPNISDSPSGKWGGKQEGRKSSSGDGGMAEKHEDGDVRLMRSDSQEGVKARSQSINEQLSKSVEKSSGKAKLLERMSKMGQALLPPSGSVEADHDSDEGQEKKPDRTDSPYEKDARSSNTEQQPAVMKSSHDPAVTHSGSPPKPQIRPKPEHGPRHGSVGEQPHPPPIQHGHPTGSQPYIQAHPTYPQGQQLAVFQAQQPNVYSMNAVQPGGFATVTPTVSYSSTELNLLMTESKVQHGETKLALSRVTDKIEDVQKKLDRIEITQLQNTKAIVGPGAVAEMEASVLMSNITRIIQENDKLKKECSEKTSKIETLNEKMADLLHKNQLFLEKSNQFMEKRADSMNDNTTQAMAKIVALEQEKATAVARFTSSQSQVTQLEQSVADITREKGGLQTAIDKIKNERDKLKAELTMLDSSANETKDEVDQLKRVIKEGKQERKKLALKLEHTEDEMADLKIEKESLEENLNEWKRKLKAERKRHEEGVDALKSSHESELKALRDLSQKTDSSEQSKVMAIEQCLRAKFEDEKAREIDELNGNWREKMTEMQNEKESLRRRTESLSRQLSTSEKDTEGVTVLKQKVEELDQEKAEMQQALSMTKEASIAKISKLMEQITEAEEKGYQKGLTEGKEEATNQESKANNQGENADVGEGVKKVMNGLFFKLRSEFEPDESYTGKEVITEILQTIKKKSTPEESESEKEDEDEDDDEEENDDEEEDDDEEDVENQEDDEENAATDEEEEKEEESNNENIVKENEISDEMKLTGSDEVDVQSPASDKEEIDNEARSKGDDMDSGDESEGPGTVNEDTALSLKASENYSPDIKVDGSPSDNTSSDPLNDNEDGTDVDASDGIKKSDDTADKTERSPELDYNDKSHDASSTDNNNPVANTTTAIKHDSDDDSDDELFKDARPVQPSSTEKSSDEDDGKAKESETKEASKTTNEAPSAFRRSPPPLFDDDDDDINWI